MRRIFYILRAVIRLLGCRMGDFKLTVPVAFIIFNRPDTTERVFDAIAKAKPSKLLVIADGPRANREGEAEKCAATRAVIERVDWPCEVLTNFSDVNLGCKRRVSSGIDWVFENVEEAIILEDDCLPDPSFFQFCQSMLVHYRDDERILMVSGTNLAWDLPQEADYYFSRYPHIWGWASWRRAWKDYDVAMQNLPELLADKNFKNSFTSTAEYKFWARTLSAVRDGKIDTWDAQVVYLAFAKSQLTVFSSGNLISNIGFGENATHTVRANMWVSDLPIKAFAASGELKSPKFMIPNARAECIRKRKEGIGVNRFLWYLKYLILTRWIYGKDI